MQTDYRQIRDPTKLSISEGSNKYEFFTERHLQALWLEQHYFSNLRTAASEPIEVLSPGIWNEEAGPDFLKAHLRIGREEIQGDVEIHLVDDSWRQHGHDRDPRYQGVILHVALRRPKNPSPLLRCDGKSLTTVYIENCLNVPINRLTQVIDIDLYPYKKFLGSGKCAQRLFRNLSTTRVEELLKSAAEYRLEAKRHYLQRSVPKTELQLLAAMVMALGYKSNALTFLELFLWLLSHQDLSADQLFSLALGRCGLFSPTYCDRWKDSVRYCELERIWGSLQDRHPGPSFCLEIGQQRPLNHPVRRLVYLTRLALDQSARCLMERLEACWELTWRQKAHGKWGRLQQELASLLPTYQDVYWSAHYLFETESRAAGLPLMGAQVKRSILVNGFLPLFQGHILQRGLVDEQEAFNEFYSSFRAPESGKRRYLKHRFFGDSGKGALLKRAVLEQGAFQIHRDFCIYYEASCEGCPFVDRVNSHNVVCH